MRKLIYVANARIPTERAHGTQIIKMCEAFAIEGIAVELALPRRKTSITQDPFEYYRVRRNFKIIRLWCLDTVRFGRWGFRIETIAFALGALSYVFSQRDAVFYTRDEFMAFFLRLLGKRVVWEVHMGQQNFLAKLIVRAQTPLVVITTGLKRLYLSLGASEDRIIVAPDAVDLREFDIKESREKARQMLGLPLNKKLVIYTGSKQSWKGVETLEAVQPSLCPGIDVVIVSGRPHPEIPLYLKAADVLVLPNTSREDISKLYTSPMKLFEYMASSTPIVSSDLPSIREILDEDNAYFFTPDDSESLAALLHNVLACPEEAQEKAQRARRLVEQYSWQSRAALILRYIYD